MFFLILVLICGWGYNKVKDGGPKEDCTKRPDWMPEPGWENVRQKGGFISHGGYLAGRENQPLAWISVWSACCGSSLGL